MAIEKKLIHFKKWSDFSSKKLSANEQNTQYTLGVDGALTTGAPDILYQSICWIKDVRKMWTHGTVYDCSGGVNVDLSNYVTQAELDELVEFVNDMNSDVANLIDTKQDNITDLADIRSGAEKGATSVQPSDISEFITVEDLAKVATSGSYNDLQDKPTIPSAINIAGTNYTPSDSGIIDLNTAYLYRKPSGGIPQSDLSGEVQGALRDAIAYKGTVTQIRMNGSSFSPTDGEIDLGNIPTSIPTEVYIADFTMESLKNGMNNGAQVGCDMQALITALSANKVILVRESEISDYKGVHVLNGFAEDLLYFSIVDSQGNILYCDGTNYTDTYIDGQTLHLQDWWKKQDTLVSGENIKTINGESIVGSGNITISGGGSSGGSGAYAEVNHGTSDTTFTLTPNTFHVWDEVASLTFDLGSETSGIANEYLFQFTSGATATSLTLPDDIKWTNDTPPTIAENMIYQVSILKGLASVLEFSNAPALIENKVTVSISGTKYLVSLQYAAASNIVVKVSTGDGLISVNISSGEISRSVSPVGPMVDSRAYIDSIVPRVDNVYNYVW